MMAGMRDDIKASLAQGVPFPKRLGQAGKILSYEHEISCDL